MRLILEDGSMGGVVPIAQALTMAHDLGSDLIEISPNANPPVAKIMDFGKFQYIENKKLKAAKANSKVSELKSLQVKVATGDHDLELKALQASKFLKEGHRVKFDLFLRGRVKYMDFNFLKGRLERVLTLITEEYKVVDPIKKSMKGLTVMIEKAK